MKDVHILKNAEHKRLSQQPKDWSGTDRTELTIIANINCIYYDCTINDGTRNP